MIYEYFSTGNRKVVDDYLIENAGGYTNGCLRNWGDLSSGDELVIDNPLTLGNCMEKVIARIYGLIHKGIRVTFVNPAVSFSPHAFCETDSLLGAVNSIDQYLVQSSVEDVA